MTLSTRINLNAAFSVRTAADLGADSGTRALSVALSLTNGTAVGQADLVFTDTRTLAASTAEDLDLAGALVGPLGAAQVFARVKALVVVADAGNTNNVMVGGDAAAAWATWVGDVTDVVRLRPGATLALLAGDADATGYAVTATTADLLQIANSGAGTSVTYSIAIVGCSA